MATMNRSDYDDLVRPFANLAGVDLHDVLEVVLEPDGFQVITFAGTRNPDSNTVDADVNLRLVTTVDVHQDDEEGDTAP